MPTDFDLPQNEPEIQKAVALATADHPDHWICHIRYHRKGIMIALSEEESATQIVRFRWQRIFVESEINPTFIRETVAAAIKDRRNWNKQYER